MSTRRKEYSIPRKEKHMKQTGLKKNLPDRHYRDRHNILENNNKKQLKQGDQLIKLLLERTTNGQKPLDNKSPIRTTKISEYCVFIPSYALWRF
jgi:hypothetical protein